MCQAPLHSALATEGRTLQAKNLPQIYSVLCGVSTLATNLNSRSGNIPSSSRNVVCWLARILVAGLIAFFSNFTNRCNSDSNYWTYFCFLALSHIALDWISGNWYLLGYKSEVIVVCNSTLESCTEVLDEGVGDPKGFALDPTRG